MKKAMYLFTCLFLAASLFVMPVPALSTDRSEWTNVSWQRICVDNNTYLYIRQQRYYNNKWEYRTVMEFVGSGCIVAAKTPIEDR